MKTCTRCKEPKSFECFPKRTRSSDGLASWCTTCHTTHAREKRQASPEERARKKRNQKALFERNQVALVEYLSTHPCIGCGESDIVLLDFDHKDRATKQYNIGDALHHKSWNTILAEIEKCVVRCVVCHRRRTAEQLGWWRHDFRV